MINYLKLLITILFMPIALFTQEVDEKKAMIDSLEESQIQLIEKDEKKETIDSLEELKIQLKEEGAKVRAKLDSLNSLVSEEYKKSGVIDTIVGVIEKRGTVYQQPDILSKKLFKAMKHEIVVIIGFKAEWFKIIHKKGIGFILEESIKHDNKIYNYKKIQSEKNKNEQEGNHPRRLVK